MTDAQLILVTIFLALVYLCWLVFIGRKRTLIIVKEVFIEKENDALPAIKRR